MNTNDKWIEQTKSNGLEPKEKARHGMTWNGGTKTRQTNEMAWHRMEKKAVGMEWNGMEWKEWRYKEMEWIKLGEGTLKAE